MVKSDLEKKLHLREMELNSLLEVTESINANLPEEDLYKIYHFTSIASLQIKKLALYVLDSEWNCKVCYGTEKDYKDQEFNPEILNIKNISKLSSEVKDFDEFDVIIPIAHKTRPLAYVFLSGEEEGGITDTSFIQTFTSIILVAIENKKLARKELEQEVFRKELEIAREVQTMLFPTKLPNTNQLKIHATYLPHHTVGGDYYDYIQLDENNFLICIADVSGKGIPASLLMSNFQASLRTLVRQTSDLKQIVSELNFVIMNNAKGDRYITFFVAAFDLKNKCLKYINAGHNPPVLVWENGDMQLLEKGCTVLGAFNTLPAVEEGLVPMPSSALLFAYTDGLTETSNEKDEEFGIEKIQDFLSKQKTQDFKRIHESLHKNLIKYKGANPFPDDIAYISCAVSF